MLDNTPQTQEQEDKQVQDAVEQLLALQDLTKTTKMSTNHTQTRILKSLSARALTRVAVFLKQLADKKSGQEHVAALLKRLENKPKSADEKAGRP